MSATKPSTLTISTWLAEDSNTGKWSICHGTVPYGSTSGWGSGLVTKNKLVFRKQGSRVDDAGAAVSKRVHNQGSGDRQHTDFAVPLEEPPYIPTFLSGLTIEEEAPDTVVLMRDRGSSDFGFSVGHAHDVTTIRRLGPAAKHLGIGDVIVKINDVTLDRARHHGTAVQDIIRGNKTDFLRLGVRRNRNAQKSTSGAQSKLQSSTSAASSITPSDELRSTTPTSASSTPTGDIHTPVQPHTVESSHTQGTHGPVSSTAAAELAKTSVGVSIATVPVPSQSVTERDVNDVGARRPTEENDFAFNHPADAFRSKSVDDVMQCTNGNAREVSETPGSAVPDVAEEPTNDMNIPEYMGNVVQHTSSNIDTGTVSNPPCTTPQSPDEEPPPHVIANNFPGPGAQVVTSATRAPISGLKRGASLKLRAMFEQKSTGGANANDTGKKHPGDSEKSTSPVRRGTSQRMKEMFEQRAREDKQLMQKSRTSPKRQLKRNSPLQSPSNAIQNDQVHSDTAQELPSVVSSDDEECAY